jgi:hypothetical protein
MPSHFGQRSFEKIKQMVNFIRGEALKSHGPLDLGDMYKD